MTIGRLSTRIGEGFFFALGFYGGYTLLHWLFGWTFL